MGFPRILSNNNKVYTKLGEFCLSGDGDHFWIVCHTCQLELQTHNFWEHIQEEHSFIYNTNQDQLLADASLKTKKPTPSTPYEIQEEFSESKENTIASPYDSDEPESITIIDANEIEVKEEPGTDEEYSSFENPIYASTGKQNADVASNSNSKRKRKHDLKHDDNRLIKRSEKITDSSSADMTLLPGNKAKVDDADALKRKLIEWNLEHIYEGMSACGVTIERLKFLEKDDIDNIFPGREKVGLRAEIRERIAAWKMKNFQVEIPATVTPKSNLTPKSFSSILPVNSGHVSNILQMSNPGKGLLIYYKENKKLEKEHRKAVLNCIIEYYYDSSKNQYFVPKNNQLEQIAEQIVEIFPTESKDVYFISRRATKANPSGLLYNRFNNINRNKRKLSTGQTMQLENFATVSQEAVFEPCPESDSVKKKMKIMQNVEDEAQGLWLKTYEYRRNTIRQFQKLTEIFEEWPFFKQAGGEKFIDLDFEMLHPQKKYMLINKWGKFQESLASYYQKYIKDKQYRLLFEKISNEKIDKNSKDCISVMLLNTILKPTSRVTIRSEAGTSFKKITMRDAINSCIIHITTPDDLQCTIEDQLKTHTPRKGTIQPYIIVVGADITTLTDFYVCIGETLFKFTSFIAAFDICFKAFHVFDLQYPKESHLLWLCTQKYIFDVTTVHDIKSSTLAEFLNTIKNY